MVEGSAIDVFALPQAGWTGVRRGRGGRIKPVYFVNCKTPSAIGPVTEEMASKYIYIWKEIGFLGLL